MISVKTNINTVSTKLINKLKSLSDVKPLLRHVAFDVLSLMRERIHEDGKAADDSSLGNYSNSYLQFRKDNGRSNGGSKKRLTFTRQLEKSLDAVPTDKGFGIGIVTDQRLPLDNFLNKKNKAKGSKGTTTVNISNKKIMEYQEAQTGKKIWKLTKSEKEYAINKLKKLVSEKLNNQ